MFPRSAFNKLVPRYQVLTAGDQTFTKPGNISAEAALYLEAQ